MSRIAPVVVGVVVCAASLLTASGAGAQTELHTLLEAAPCDLIDIPVRIQPGDAGGAGEAGGVPLTFGQPQLSDSGTIVYMPDAHVPMNTFLVPDTLVIEALTGGDSWENEAHDCQRLVLARAASRERTRSDTVIFYGPLVGLFPLDSAMKLDTAWTDPLAVATVYNWGDWALQPQRYIPLGIDDGWHCLWLRQQDGRWQAAIAPTRGPCARQSPPGRERWTLTVVESRHVAPGRGPVEEVYPRTVRWGYDMAASLQYIGIKCGDAWCSIGASAPPVPARLSGPIRRVVPGWYDEQPLAVVGGTGGVQIPPQAGVPMPIPGGPDDLMPGAIGRIYPDSTFWFTWNPIPMRQDGPRMRAASDSIRHAAMERRRVSLQRQIRTGMTVARIEMLGAPNAIVPYEQKFALDHNSGRAGGAVNMGGTSPAFTGEFRSAKGHRVADVTFVPGVSHSVRGAVRWRWDERDERVWVSCDDGCCTIQPR